MLIKGNLGGRTEGGSWGTYAEWNKDLGNTRSEFSGAKGSGLGQVALPKSPSLRHPLVTMGACPCREPPVLKGCADKVAQESCAFDGCCITEH